MERWARAGRTAAARLLARLLGDPQPAGPEDLPEDGTPYGRYRDHPAVAALRQAHGELAARLAARLVEVAALVAALSGFAQGGAAPTTVSSTVDATEGAGHARVDVARGTLVHDVRLAGGRVAEYRIAAPTTANFSAGGAADRALLRIRGSDPGEIEWRARLTILEFDPCVAHELRIR